MLRLLEGFSFVSLAAGLHVLAFSAPGLPGRDGPLGEGGQLTLAVQAAPETLSALAERWDIQPDVAQDTVPPVQPDADMSPAAPTMVAALPPRMQPGQIAPLTQEATPRADAQSAALPAALPPAPTVTPGLSAPSQDSAADAPMRLQRPAQPTAPAATPAPKVDALPFVNTAPAAPLITHAPDQSPRPRARVVQKPTAKPAPKPKSTARAAPAPSKKSAPSKGATATVKSTVSPQAARQAEAKWGGQIRARVEARKRYPRGTRAKGTVTLRIVVARSGALQSVSIRKSSGTPALDAAAIKAVRSARFPAAPKALVKNSYSFSLPMAFSR